MTKGFVDPETGEVKVPGEEAPGTDVVKARPAPLELPKLAEMIAQAKDASDEDPDAIAMRIVERILQATSAEEVLASQEARHARELLGQPIIVDSIRFNESDFSDGFEFYMLIDATDIDTGDKMVVTVGGRTVMAQLFRLHQLGALPAKVKFVQPAKPTRSGFFPLWLQPA